MIHPVLGNSYMMDRGGKLQEGAERGREIKRDREREDNGRGGRRKLIHHRCR